MFCSFFRSWKENRSPRLTEYGFPLVSTFQKSCNTQIVSEIWWTSPGPSQSRPQLDLAGVGARRAEGEADKTCSQKKRSKWKESLDDHWWSSYWFTISDSPRVSDWGDVERTSSLVPIGPLSLGRRRQKLLPCPKGDLQRRNPRQCQRQWLGFSQGEEWMGQQFELEDISLISLVFNLQGFKAPSMEHPPIFEQNWESVRFSGRACSCTGCTGRTGRTGWAHRPEPGELICPFFKWFYCWKLLETGKP